jgi:hypothetical protein
VLVRDEEHRVAVMSADATPDTVIRRLTRAREVLTAPVEIDDVRAAPIVGRAPAAELIWWKTAGILATVAVRSESMDGVLSRLRGPVDRRSTACAGSDRFEQEVFDVQRIVPICEQRCSRGKGDRLARLAVEHEEPVAEIEHVL